MATILVIADDYTGALDTGVQFASSGARVCVATAERLLESMFDAHRRRSGAGCDTKEKANKTNSRKDNGNNSYKTVDCLLFLKAEDEQIRVDGNRTFDDTNKAISLKQCSCLSSKERRREAEENIPLYTRIGSGDDYGNYGDYGDYDDYDDYDVFVADTETRHISPRQASSLVYALTRKATELGFSHFYKKTDSALRGNIGAELSAMLEANGDTTLAFAPAYPKSGRVTVNGIHYIDGVELSASVFGEDPFSPVKYSEVRRIVEEQTDITIINRSAEVYRTYCMDGVWGVRGVRPVIAPVPERERESLIEIYDAESDADLRRLGFYLKSMGRLKSLAGCAGFAGVLPEIYGIGSFGSQDKAIQTGNFASGRKYGDNTDLPETEMARMTRTARTTRVTRTTRMTRTTRNLLLVTGSVNPITLKQLAYAEKRGFYTITLSPEQKLFMNAEMEEVVAEAVSAALRGQGRVIIAAAATIADVERTDDYARGAGISSSELRGRISAGIGRLTANVLRRHNVDALAVFGGDTLYEIMNQAGAEAISPLRELATGIVEAKIISARRNRNPLLITKSGGLGGDDAIDVIVDYLFNV